MKWAGGVAEVIEHLLPLQKVLGLIPSTNTHTHTHTKEKPYKIKT
jgi:hypothetical protein